MYPFIVKSFLFHPLPTSSPGAKCRPSGRLPHLPPVTRHLSPATGHSPQSSPHRSSLPPAPHACIYRRYRACALPLFLPSACTQVPVSPWGVCMEWFPPRLCVPESPSPIYPPNIGIVWFLVSLLGGFLQKGERPGYLHSLAVTRPGFAPPATWPCQHRSGYLPPYHLPPTPYRRDPIPGG